MHIERRPRLGDHARRRLWIDRGEVGHGGSPDMVSSTNHPRRGPSPRAGAILSSSLRAHAKQSIPPLVALWIASSLALLAMLNRYTASAGTKQLMAMPFCRWTYHTTPCPTGLRAPWITARSGTSIHA